MKTLVLCLALMPLLLPSNPMAATEEAKQLAIDDGLAWLATVQTPSGAEAYWFHTDDGTLAATAAAAAAFIQEGYLPGDGSIYDDIVTKAVAYVFNRATVDDRFAVETAVYERYAEDYDNDGVYDDGNDEAIFFDPGNPIRRVYTTGIVATLVYALGESLGVHTVIGMGSPAVIGKTYAQAMQDVVDWFCWAQVEPDCGDFRGGWRYDANSPNADNSTAQWGSLPLLYAADWGLGAPQYVFDELELWVNYIQNANGGSGYDNPGSIVNVSKTGGLLLELAAIGAPASDPRVTAAIDFINSRWNTTANGEWYGNLGHPYAIWSVYKALQVYGFLTPLDCGPEDILVGMGIPAAPGGFTICFDATPAASAAGDWFSQYCDHLVGIQNGDGSWSGYIHWTWALPTAWYINILNAVQVHSGPYIDVSLDIKPASCPNPLNIKSGGVLPVAILGTVDFDVMDIDPSTVALEGVDPLRYRYEDVATPFTGELCDCHGLSHDGYVDMTLKFETQDVAAVLEAMKGDVSFPGTQHVGGGRAGRDAASAAQSQEYVRLTLTGMTWDGREIRGQDCVRVTWKTGGRPDGSDEENEPGVSGRAGSTATLRVTYQASSGSGCRITFGLPEPAQLTLCVYDVAGRRVATLVNQSMSEGVHSVTWDGRTDSGVPVEGGVYFVKMSAPGIEKMARLIIVG